MTPSMPSGEHGIILVPARPVLDDLVESDSGTRLHEAQLNGTRWEMIEDGLCGLLYPDIGHLSDAHRGAFACEIEKIRDKHHLVMVAPQNVLDNASLDRLSSAGTSIIAGLAYAPEQVTHTREVVRTILDRSDVTNEVPDSEEISIVFQGGARVSDDEYQFSKEVGRHIAQYNHAPKKFITGGGRGIMRGPHSGAVAAGVEDTKSCGISCGKIIAAEPPNSLVKHLAVFEQIERRLEAFTRSGQLTVLFPGGTGTFEELLYVLAVLLEEKNKDIHYSFLLVGSEQHKEHYDIILRTLEQALGTDVLQKAGLRDRVCIGKPETVGARILHEVEKAKQARKLEMQAKNNDPNIRPDFHGDIHIPSGLRIPFQVTRQNVADLELHRDQTPSQTIINMRRFVYTVTCACISTERKEVEQNGPFKVHGESQMTTAVDDLMQFLAATKRMNGGDYKQPYVLSAR